MRFWLSAILIFAFAICFNQNISAQTTENAYLGEARSFSVNGDAGNTYVWKLTRPDQSVQVLPSTTSTSGVIEFTNLGAYLLWVQATDRFGCLSEPITKTINVLPVNKIAFTASTGTACYQANNQFSIPLRFFDHSGQPLASGQFPMQVAYRVNGVAQPAQTVSFANQNLTVSGNSFTANPQSDTSVEIELTGATDSQNKQIQPETTSGQHIYMHTIFRQLTAPTVTALTTNDATPVVTGTATVAANELFSVSVNRINYTPGDGFLTLAGGNWSLAIPASRALPEGVYEVTATVSNPKCSLADATTNELTIDLTDPTPPPTVVSQTTDQTEPVIRGTATLGLNETLTVTVNGQTYKAGDGHLVVTGNQWLLTIPVVHKLPEGTYQVMATVTDAAGNSTSDLTTNELVISLKPPITDRLATNDVNIAFRNTAVTGNVVTNDAGFYGFNPVVKIYLEPVNGALSMSPDGNYTYTPNPNFTGVDNFYYSVCTAENPADCDTVNVTILVVTDDFARMLPIASDDEVQMLSNSPATGNVLANDLSISGERLILNTKPLEGPRSGTLVLNTNGTFVYTPQNGFVGSDYFVYEVCGYVTGVCAKARVTITVSEDETEARLFAADDLFYSNGKTTSGNVLANDSYAAGANPVVNSQVVSGPQNGSVSISANGNFSYTPTSGFTGTDQFVYEVCGATPKDCDLATVSILVKEPPTVYADLSIQKSAPASITPGETITYQLTVTNLGTAQASKVQISDFLSTAVLNPQYRVQPSTTWKEWTGYYEHALLDIQKSFSLTISGTVASNAPDTLKNFATVSSSAWDPVTANNVSVVKTVVRRGPVARIAGAPYLAVGQCNTQGRVLDASKSGGEGLSFAWSPSAFLDNPTSSKPLFRPGATTRYRLTVTDSQGRSDTTSILVIVPNAPLAVTDKNVFVDAPNASILLNGSRSTGVGLTYLWQTKEGIIIDGETRPNAMVSGLGMYYLNVTDSLGCTARDSVNVGLYIQAINDTTKTNVNESVMINVLRNDIPQNGINPSTISIVTPPLHGIASVAADSLILYIPHETYIGQDEFIYAICDYFQNCDQAKVLVLVNDIPFFIPEAFSPNGDGINDLFEIKGLAKYKTVEIQIFNRWGNIVYQSNNYGNGPGKDGFWDGTVKNGLRVGSGPVPTGTYYFILTLNGNEKISRSVYLDR